MDHNFTLIIVGLVLLIGIIFGRGARRVRLPSVIGYMALGILLGPSLSRILPFEILNAERMNSLSFITDVSLGFVAFNIGAELHLGSLKRLGFGIISIIFAESFGAFFLVTGMVYALTALLGKADLPIALIFGAMAPASAPAGTVAVIQEYRAKGPLTKALYAVIGFDDGLAIIIFGFAAALARMMLEHGASGSTGLATAVIGPSVEICESLLVGGIIGLLFSWVASHIKRSHEMLIFLFGTVFAATGLSLWLGISSILVNLMIGFVLVNVRREEVVRRAAQSMTEIMPMIFLLFFTLAGAYLDVTKLPALGLIGLVYIIGRTVGLIGGARLGAMVGRVNENVKKYVGLGILNQAGVAIGLAMIVAKDFSQLSDPHASEIAAQCLACIMATSIVFGIIGPLGTRIALQKAGEIPDEET